MAANNSKIEFRRFGISCWGFRLPNPSDGEKRRFFSVAPTVVVAADTAFPFGKVAPMTNLVSTPIQNL